MVRKKQYHSKRYAFTMIELIFAIVIIAISVMSLPVMSGATQKGVEEGIVQEAIFASSAELMSALAGYWDENSMEDINVSKFSRVINLKGDCDAGTKLRPGHINQPYHRRCLDNITTTNPLDTADTSKNIYDLNDIAYIDQDIFISGSVADATGYKKIYKGSISVSRSGNVKTVVSTIKDNGEVIVKLKAQSANIGEVDFYKRTL